MSESDTTDSPKPKSFAGQVGRVFQKYFSDPQTPRLEEIGRLAEDLLLRNAELESKVSNLRKMAQQLEAYRDRYVDLYELAPVGYATLDEEGYVQEINVAGSQLLGADRDGMIGFPLDSYVDEQDREEFLQQIRRCCCDHQVLTFEVALLAKDGKSIAAHIRGVPIEPLGAEATFCKIAMTDISERKAAEEAIRASEANYRAIFDTANDAIFVHDADTGAILDANQAATDMYGYTTEDFRRMPIEAISEGRPPYSQNDALQWIQRAIAGVPQRFDWKCRNRAGDIFWAEINLKRTALNGQPRLLAIVRDITERKDTEEALQASEDRFRMVADYTYDWEYWTGPDGKYRYVSPSCQRITGYSSEEFIANPALLNRIVHADDRKRMASHFRCESPTLGSFIGEFRIVSKKGDERWIEHICQPVYSVDQRWLGQRASNRDITDRKNAELKLRERIRELEERLSKGQNGS